MKRIHFLPILATVVWAQPPDSVQLAIQRYNQVTENCPGNSCPNDAREAAADIMQRLVARRAIQAANQEGSRLALSLLPDRQLGSSPSTGGGTSLTSLASISNLFSAAMESGAFQRNTAGSISTIRVNPAATVYLLSGKCPPGSQTGGPLCIRLDRSPWRGLSVFSSFDSSQSDQAAPGNAADPGASASAVLLRAKRGPAAAGVRYEFFKPTNQKLKTSKERWEKGVKSMADAAADYAKATATGPGEIVIAALSAGMPAELHEHLIGLEPDDRFTAAEKFFDGYLAAREIKLAPKKLKAYRDARNKLVTAQVAHLRETLDRRLFSLELVHQRPKDEPEYGTFTLIWGDTAGTHKEATDAGEQMVPDWSLTANAGANFFYGSPHDQRKQRLRDVHFAFQADHKLWKWRALNQPTFTLAAYYQRLTDDAVLAFNSDAIAPGTGIALPKPANVILKDTKGNVGIAQAKLTIPLKDSGVSFPIAISWSNRSELLRVPGNDVRGNFGVQFDLEKFFTGLKPR